MHDDRELIRRVVDGDPEAAELFVIRFTRFVWAILARELRLSEAMAQDVYQEIFVRLWEDDYRRLTLWSGDGEFCSYLAPLVRHLALDHLRAAGRLPGPLPDRRSGGLPEPAGDEPGPDELAALAEQRAAVRRAVERLGPRDRELYDRRFEREQSYREIARAMDMTVNHVGVALLRLERKLARLAAGGRAARDAPGRAGVRSPAPGASGSRD